MMRKGFSLIEVMFGLLIGGLITTILFTSLAQTNQIFSRVTSVTFLERQVALMQQQFETDFSGMFSPTIIEFVDDEPGKEGKKEEKDGKKESDKKEEKEKPIFKSFVFEGSTQGLVKIMSFITTNPLLSYKQRLPRAVRVAYRVVPDPEHEGKLLLVRQQSEELSLELFEAATKKETIKTDQAPIRSYEIVRNIESVKFEFFIEKKEKPETDKKPATPVQPPADKKEEKDTEDKPRVFILIEEWLKLSDEEKKKYEEPEIPAFIHMTIVMNDERKHQRSFEFWWAPCYGIAPLVIKGITSDLPNEFERNQRRLADEHTQRQHMFDKEMQPEDKK